MKYQIRKAKLSDLVEITKIHQESLFHEGFGDFYHYCSNELEYNKLFLKWESIYQKKTLIMVAEIEDKIIGFCAIGANLNKKYIEFESELMAIHCLKEYRNLGIGKALFNATINELKKMSISSMILWSPEIFSGNTFFEKMGAKKISIQKMKVESSYIQSFTYGWYNFEEN